MKTIFLCILLSLLFISKTSLSNPDPLTGAIIIAGLNSTAQSIVNNAGEQARATANEVAAKLTTIAAELQQALADNINKPITELNANLKLQADRAFVALDLSKEFIRATSTCLISDMQGLIASLNSTITYNVSNITFWKHENPIVYSINRIGASSVYGFRVNNNATLVLRGANFNFNNKCEPQLLITNIDDNSTHVKGTILAKDAQSVTIRTEVFNKVGLYVVDIKYFSKVFFGCRNQEEIKTFIYVLPKPLFQVQYTITPYCKGTEIVPFDAGKLDDTNDGCDGDKFPEMTGTLPGGLTYDHHEFIETSANGCEKTNDQYLGSNQVRIKYRLPQPNCVWHLTSSTRVGARTWIHGHLVIYGKRDKETEGLPIQGNINDISYEQSKSIRINYSNCEIKNWNVRISVTSPDGKPFDIDPKHGEGELTNSSNGVSYKWEPVSKTLTITTPRYGCD